MKKNIAILPGDGIGQEIMPHAVKALHVIAEKYNHHFEFHEVEVGGAAFEKYGSHFPEQTKKICEQADAVLFGSVGGPVSEAHLPKWKNCERNSILALRKTLNLSMNLRPASVYPALAASCPLKDHVIKNGIDLLIVRELLGDIYFGEHKRWHQDNISFASDVAEYNEKQISSIAHRAFQLAKLRRGKLTSVDKANVLETSKLWREVVSHIALDYPDVIFENMLVDNCAMQLVIDPAQFDVILTANLFGDILSDLAAALPGSLGLMPSASLNENGFGLYEPSGGSAPDIAGKNKANPIGQILSAALLLRYSFGFYEEADAIEMAVQGALRSHYRTADIYHEGLQLVTTEQMASAIIERIL